MQINFLSVCQTDENSGYFIISADELEKIRLSIDDINDVNSKKMHDFYKYILPRANELFFNNAALSILTEMAFNDEGDMKIIFHSSNASSPVQAFIEQIVNYLPFNDWEDCEDYEECYEYEPCCSPFAGDEPELYEDTEQPIGLVETYSFSECLKLIDFLKTVQNNTYEVIHVDDIYYVNIQGCGFDQGVLIEFGAQEVHSEKYIDIIHSRAIEHGGSTFLY